MKIIQIVQIVIVKILMILQLGVKYKKLGFYTVIIEKPAVVDIGDDHHVSEPTRKWPKRRKTGAPRGLKRLWKHIKTFKF